MGANLLYDEQPFEHFFPTPEKFGYDGLAKIFNHILPKVQGIDFNGLKPPVEDWENYGVLHKFNQEHFNEPGAQMQPEGYLFFPY